MKIISSLKDIDALEKISLIKDLRMENFQVLVGINFATEGLDTSEFL